MQRRQCDIERQIKAESNSESEIHCIEMSIYCVKEQSPPVQLKSGSYRVLLFNKCENAEEQVFQFILGYYEIQKSLLSALTPFASSNMGGGKPDTVFFAPGRVVKLFVKNVHLFQLRTQKKALLEKSKKSKTSADVEEVEASSLASSVSASAVRSSSKSVPKKVVAAKTNRIVRKSQSKK